jgi:hypothetical protein
MTCQGGEEQISDVQVKAVSWGRQALLTPFHLEQAVLDLLLNLQQDSRSLPAFGPPGAWDF